MKTLRIDQLPGTPRIPRSPRGVVKAILSFRGIATIAWLTVFVILVIASLSLEGRLYKSATIAAVLKAIEPPTPEWRELMSFIAGDNDIHYSSFSYSESNVYKSWWIVGEDIPKICYELTYAYNEAYKNITLEFDAKVNKALKFDLPIGTNVRYVHGTFSTIASHSELRQVHRKYLKSYGNVYNSEANPEGTFLVLFVTALPKTEEEIDIVLKEQEIYKDVVVLENFESMNCGKTYDWYRYAWERILRDRPTIWAVGKGDMDTFVRYVPVEQALDKILLQDKLYNLYWGWDMGKPGFMYGMCYFMSRSNVHFVAEFPPFNKSYNSMGIEDHLSGWWMETKSRIHGFGSVQAVQFIHDDGFHDWGGVECGMACNQPTNKTLALHRCRTEEQFKHLKQLWPDPISPPQW
jgi:hypothetical protein